jgi:hypothetical protein
MLVQLYSLNGSRSGRRSIDESSGSITLGDSLGVRRPESVSKALRYGRPAIRSYDVSVEVKVFVDVDIERKDVQ